MSTREIHSFVVINGAKKSNKQFTIELWGGQGGGSNGGRGGYTKLVSKLGNKFNEGTVLYVGVGGQGSGVSAGFNGGGSTPNSGSYKAYGGGGATHIATKSGVLSSLSGSKSSVIAVAGGGGGATWALTQQGGYGGGANMNGGNGTSVSGFGGGGGTLSRGGLTCFSNRDACSYKSDGSFGIAGNGGASTYSNYYNSGGGGGGYYGGGGGSWANHLNKDRAGSGGGGSGYCNTSLGTCSGSNGQRSGVGYAKISW